MTSNQYWWPNQVTLKVLSQNSPLSDPMGKDFNYAEEFKTLDIDALRKDIEKMNTIFELRIPCNMTGASQRGRMTRRSTWKSRIT
ncbi:MAG: hypothetical protein O7B27_13725 [Gammaproteobacteria bacterium]|nr:hypothetical protein [Gammaproteobacteria bacterium]